MSNFTGDLQQTRREEELEDSISSLAYKLMASGHSRADIAKAYLSVSYMLTIEQKNSVAIKRDIEELMLLADDWLLAAHETKSQR